MTYPRDFDTWSEAERNAFFADSYRKLGDGNGNGANGHAKNQANQRSAAEERSAKLEVIEESLSPEFSEDRLALEFATKHQAGLRYVAKWGRWLQWIGNRWTFDDVLNVYTFARGICRESAARCKSPGTAANLAKSKTVSSVEILARCDDRLKATAAQWDADLLAVNTPGAFINLRKGEGRPGRLDDYCMKQMAVTPDIGEPALFLEFLNRIMNSDKALISYLQRVFGYCLSGVTSEHAMFFFYGTGANGKSVLLSTIAGIFGDYHKTSAIETFTVSTGTSHPTDLANLMGARLVTAIETEEGRRWAEAKIKALTGGDTISARFMRQDFFEFVPQFKLIVAGNHKPALRTVDEAMRRRLHMVPFAVTIPERERDPNLLEKLKAEWPQILQWMIEGAIEWQRMGLCPPDAVRAATAAYFEAQDSLAAWIEDRCETGINYREPRTALFLSWKGWAENAGEFVGDQKSLFEKLDARGFERAIFQGKRYFNGLRLKQDDNWTESN